MIVDGYASAYANAHAMYDSYLLVPLSLRSLPLHSRSVWFSPRVCFLKTGHHCLRIFCLIAPRSRTVAAAAAVKAQQRVLWTRLLWADVHPTAVVIIILIRRSSSSLRRLRVLHLLRVPLPLPLPLSHVAEVFRRLELGVRVVLPVEAQRSRNHVSEGLAHSEQG